MVERSLKTITIGFSINSAWLAAFSLYDRYKPFFKYVLLKVIRIGLRFMKK